MCEAMRERRQCLSTPLALLMCILSGAGWAHAGVTSIVLTSEPGDFVGGGQTLVFVQADGPFVAQTNGTVVGVRFNTPTFDHFWSLEFAAPDGQPLVVGTYEGAVRYPFVGPGQPGLSVSGDGRGCNTLTGRFEVLELISGGGSEVVSFRAVFEQHCEGGAPALRGEVRYNANVPLQLNAPSSVSAVENQPFSFLVSAVNTQGGGLVTLTASNVPFGASFVDHGNNTATFSWTPLSSQVGTYLLAIGGTAATLSDTIYVRITVRFTAPPNDELEQAIAVPGLPFTYTQQTATATVAPDDPFCAGGVASVWFTYTPLVAGRVEFNTDGSNYFTTLSAYTGTRGNLNQVACNFSGFNSRIRFDTAAGITYYIVAAAPSWAAPGMLTLNAQPAPQPFSMQFSLDSSSTVDPSVGHVIVKGTVVCSASSFVSVNGSIRQQHAAREVSGFFGAFVPCDGVTPWQAPVTYFTSGLFNGRAAALFVGGNANVTATAQAFDPIEGTFIVRNAAAAIKLQGGR